MDLIFASELIFKRTKFLIMNQLVNYVQLIGNLGQEPELQTTQNKNAMLKLSLATSENYLDKSGNWQSKTDWHNLICWGQLAERMAKSLQKGDQILVRGKLQHRKYEDDKGQTRYYTQVHVNSYMRMKQRAAVTA